MHSSFCSRVNGKSGPIGSPKLIFAFSTFVVVVLAPVIGGGGGGAPAKRAAAAAFGRCGC